MPAFAELAAAPEPRLDALAVALAAEFREVDGEWVLATLDALGAEVGRVAADASVPAERALACAAVLGGAHGFAGDRESYDDPDNSMLDLVLARRRGLPILLSVIYVEAARRAEIPLAGVGLPGHFVVGHFGAGAPLLLDPFDGGAVIAPDVPERLLRPWRAHEIALRMLNNLVGSFQRRGDLARALHAAKLRLALPVDAAMRTSLRAEVRAMQARLN